MWVLLDSHDSEELSMRTITTIGLDIAKSVFQVHGVDAVETGATGATGVRGYALPAGQLGSAMTAVAVPADHWLPL